MRLQLRSSLVKPAKKVIGKQRLTVLVNVSFPAPSIRRPSALLGLEGGSGLRPGAAGQNGRGAMAEWLCSGLQSRVPRFDSESRLQ